MNVLFVTGCGHGRCGTTWMQRVLNTVSGVAISGQPTNLPLEHAAALLRTIDENSEAAQHANRIYGADHHRHVSTAANRAAVRALLSSLWFPSTGDETVGAKLNSHCPDDLCLPDLWPNARYVAMVRHPRDCYASLVATFRPDLSWNVFLARWCWAVARSVGHPRTFVFQIDRDRASQLRRLGEFLGGPPFGDDQLSLAERREHAGLHVLPELARPSYTDEARRLMGMLSYEP